MEKKAPEQRRLSRDEIGTRISDGEPVSRLMTDDPALTTEELREAVEAYLAARARRD